MTEIRKNPKLGEANAVSLFGAVIQASQLGLDIGTKAHLVPFYNGKTKSYEVNMIPDYRGLMQLARNSGDIGAINARIVRDGDKFDYQLGTAEWINHKPKPDNDAAEITHVYAIARSSDNKWSQFEVLTRAEVDKVKAQATAGISDAAKKYAPWFTNYEAMAMKTAVKRLCKFLPSSSELQQAITLDDLSDAGVSQHNASVIDASFEHVNTETGEVTSKADEMNEKAGAA